MTQEQIEKAAEELCTTERMPQWEKDYGMFCFMDGARWRIDSVWHKPSAYGNELTNGLDVIVKTHKGYRFGIFNAVGYYNEYIGFVSASGIEYPLSDVLEYAYLTDLLPERKED